MTKRSRRARSLYVVLPIAIASAVPAINFAAPAHSANADPKNHAPKIDRHETVPPSANKAADNVKIQPPALKAPALESVNFYSKRQSPALTWMARAVTYPPNLSAPASTRQSSSATAFAAAPASVALDNSLGVAQPIPFANNTYSITPNLGRQVNGNLFYSFSAFNLTAGQIAQFSPGANPVQNVLARVTGGPSTIDGTIRCTIPSANFFLINSAGMVFGANSSLDVQGSFAVTTASQLKLGSSGGVFSAMPGAGDATLPGAAPSGFDFLASTPAGLTIDGATLSVPAGKSVLLAAGSLNFDGGAIASTGGQIGVVTVASPATVGFDPVTLLPLPLSATTARGSFVMTNDATLSADGPGGGMIQVICGDFSLTGGATIHADTQGAGVGMGISIDSTGAVNIGGGDGFGVNSGIRANVSTGAAGSGGNINLQAASLLLVDGGYISASTFGAGKAGNVAVNVSGSVILAGADATNSNSGIYTYSIPFTGGAAGSISLSAGSLQVLTGAEITTSTFGLGNAGNINVNVAGQITLSGTNAHNADSGIYANSNSQGPGGNAGSITLTSISLQLLGGAEIASETFGFGNANSVNLTVSDLTLLSGADAGAARQSGIFTSANAGGNAGAISLTTGSLQVLGGAEINSVTSSGGKSGNIGVNVSGLAMFSGADARNDDSGLFAESKAAGAGGNAGSIAFNAGALQMVNGGTFDSSTFGSGNAGNIVVNVAGQVLIQGVDSGMVRDSGLYAVAAAGGAAGSITLNAGSLQILDGAKFDTGASGLGNGGNIAVNISGPVQLSGADAMLKDSGIFANTSSTGAGGNAGSITLTANSLQALGGAEISSTTFGQGKGGNINVNVTGLATFSGADPANVDSGIYTNGHKTGIGGDAGSITLTAGGLQLQGGAEINSITSGVGRGGNINVNVAGLTLLSGYDATNGDSGIYATTLATGAGGNAGAITLNTGSLQMLGGAEIASGTFGLGRGGAINVYVAGQAMLSGADMSSPPRYSGLYTSNETVDAQGDAGSITFIANDIQMLGGAQVNSLTRGFGVGGSVTIGANTFSAGQNAVVLATTAGSAPAGSVTLNVNNNATLTGGAMLSAGTTSTGVGKDVNVSVGSLTLDNAFITADTSASGAGGNVAVKSAGQILVRNAGAISAAANLPSATGAAGGVTIHASSLTLSTGGSISTSNAGANIAGNVTIDVQNAINIFTGGGIDATAAAAQGGDVSLICDSFSLNGPASNVSTMSAKGGSIAVIAKHGNLSVTDRALISAKTTEGDGGDITLRAAGLLRIDSSNVTARAAGTGGFISIDPEYVILQHSTIDGRAGGRDVRVAIARSALFIPSGNSRILSNNLSLPPQTDVSGKLLALPSVIPRIDLTLSPVCAMHLDGDISSFIVTGQGGVAPDPGGLLPDYDIRVPDKKRGRDRITSPPIDERK